MSYSCRGKLNPEKLSQDISSEEQEIAMIKKELKTSIEGWGDWVSIRRLKEKLREHTVQCDLLKALKEHASSPAYINTN